ncbi:hypothetical protein I4641_00355 [Waterburya agarophytonicola K14]|uniref:Polysaccharide biosynthesis enzyme WcbI domain-containing protein n=1 Tax=Waterburya agarophytonicola KI4 TaxID=2874699 RepID=A0A964BMN6_9CYAN|nr:WcbI family polysaccharide biosynthesis putative acetyltransferase [Waterburya agarophytonicola]MCC0175431.1 hypothetical protein [Waterburya agarophytonicola KI4]
MKKYLIYGNCQTVIIKQLLEQNPEFNSTYEQIELKVVHLMSENDLDDLEKAVSETDIFVHQNISDNYKGIPQLGTNYLKTKLKTESKSISIPVSFFTGYNPEMVYIKDRNNVTVVSDFSDYHDFNLIKLFDSGVSPDEAAKIIQDVNFFTPRYILSNLHYSIAELERREANIDIKISNFLRKYHRNHKLFHTINHPAKVVLNYISNEILNLIGCSAVATESLFNDNEEVLDTTTFPIYPAIARQLNLAFSSKSEYKLKSNLYSLEEGIAKFFEFYEANRSLIQLNINKHQQNFSVYGSDRLRSDARNMSMLVK